MQIQTHTVGSVEIVTLTNRLDVTTAPALLYWLNQSLPPAPAKVAVDLSQVTFIDSTGLSALVQGMKRCRERKGDLRLFGLQAPVRIIFELTRLDKAFEIFIHEDETLKSFA
jgi:anti-sigma B factor antagonist